jgi:hypothetical protein
MEREREHNNDQKTCFDHSDEEQKDYNIDRGKNLEVSNCKRATRDAFSPKIIFTPRLSANYHYVDVFYFRQSQGHKR